MKNKIVICGDSPIAFFLAKLSDRDIAREVINEVIYLTQERELLVTSQLDSLIKKAPILDKSSQFQHLKFIAEPIKSIHLSHQRIVTTRRVLEFDYLIFDRTANFSYNELVNLRSSILEMIRRLKAAYNKQSFTQANVHFHGESATIYQVALATLSDLKAERKISNAISVIGDPPKGKRRLRNFLRNAGLTFSNGDEKAAKILINPSFVALSHAVKGAPVDNAGRLITDSSLKVGSLPILAVDQEKMLWRNLLTADHSYSQILYRQFLRLINEEKLRALESPSPSFLIRSGDHYFAQIGQMISGNIRARGVYKLERLLMRRLSGGNRSNG